MKLLLVDDEKLTQQGIIKSIDWDKLHIDEVLLADDGQQGLDLARQYCPEIILCDVRMPHMTGFEMIEKILEFSPDSVPVLISGYSDKEYLKAAIKLKALNYIEKPLSIEEVEQTLQEAIKQYQTTRRYRQNELDRIKNEKASLALILTMPQSEDTQKRIARLVDHANPEINEDMFYQTWVVKLIKPEQLDYSLNEKLQLDFVSRIKAKGLNILYTHKHASYHVFFIYRSFRMTKEITDCIDRLLINTYQKVEGFYAARGKEYQGIKGAHLSYDDAVLLLQSSFFFPSQSILSPENRDAVPAKKAFKEEYPHFLYDFASALELQNENTCRTLAQTLYDYNKSSYNILPNDIKDIYYRIFILIQEAEQSMFTVSYSLNQSADTLMNYLDQFETLDDVAKSLTKKIDCFFSRLSSLSKEHPMVYKIKEYISQNYSNETLSVRDISEHVNRSVSYICSFYKNETGQTLNKYITEYRLLRAKQLLKDPDIKISTISKLVGYPDGNYFAKLFKKTEGVSPSTYREKMIYE